MISDTLFDAANEIREYLKDMPHCYVDTLPLIDDLLVRMDAIRALLDTPPGTPPPITPIPEWQNLDRILDVLEKAGCTRNGHVHAAEDVVTNALRDWLRTLKT